jgi:hypothetical protein
MLQAGDFLIPNLEFTSIKKVKEDKGRSGVRFIFASQGFTIHYASLKERSVVDRKTLATVEMFSKFIRKIVFLRMLSTLKI